MSLSLFTQLRSAQVSDNYPSPRRSSGSSSLGCIPQRRILRDSLASFNVNSFPTIPELYKLQIELDYQCLQIAAATDLRPTQYAKSDVNSVVAIAVFLSGPLSLARISGTFLFQEAQLRALVSCLALLHYHAVEALYPAQWDKLRTNIAGFFQQISHQVPSPSKSTLPETIRYAPNVYLIQLVSQYLSFIRRGDSVLPSVVGPIVKIFFASVSLVGHQYNHVLEILEGLGELSSLWRTPQNKYKALCGLQEYTRLASSLRRESVDAINAEQMRRAATTIISALLAKVGEMLLTEDSLSPPRLRKQWPKTRTIIGLGPPDLDQGYYVLGLLDCAAQLATLGNPGMFPVQFVDKVMSLILENNVPEYRWKAIEILLSCRDTRRVQLQDIRTRIRSTSKPALKETLLKEVSAVHDILNDDEEASLRLNTSQLLAIDVRSPPHDNMPPNELLERPGQPIAMPIVPTVSSDPSPSIHTTETDWREPDLPTSKVRSTWSFSLSLHRAKTLGGRASFDFAGLSNDCQYAYLYHENRVSVFYLADLRAQSTESAFLRILDLGRDFTNSEPIFDVVMSGSFLVIITSLCVRVINVRNNYELEASSHSEWEPSGVACSENETRLVIALGQGQGNSLESSKGQIVLFKYEPGTRPRKISPCSTIKLPARNRPKRISLDADGRTLTCVTTIQNRLLVWHLNENFSTAGEPFDFVKNHYRVERYETGITSTSLYTSPSQKHYILATTSPSSERHRNDGEWSFSLPLDCPLPIAGLNPSTTPRLRPPSHAIHNFEQFKNHRALRTGVVSQTHNILAVMEDSGRISLLPLMAAEGGGVCGAGDGMMRILEEWKGGSDGCLRFGGDGERMVAVDARGRGVVVEFERD